VIEAWSCGAIVVSYNDHPVRAFWGGLDQWREAYREPLEVDMEQLCWLPVEGRKQERSPTPTVREEL
jgi:hypothetical protein